MRSVFYILLSLKTDKNYYETPFKLSEPKQAYFKQLILKHDDNFKTYYWMLIIVWMSVLGLRIAVGCVKQGLDIRRDGHSIINIISQK